MEGGVQSSNTGRFACGKLRWNFGTSGGWVSKGLVNVVSYMAEIKVGLMNRSWIQGLYL